MPTSESRKRKKKTKPHKATDFHKADLPKIAIIGRPNVGKSTLYNRILGKRNAIVQRESGTTRDSLYDSISWNGKQLAFVDTGGLRLEKRNRFSSIVDEAVIKAARQANFILFLVDGKTGLTPSDEEIAAFLRKEKKDILVTVNKIDCSDEHIVAEFYELGFPVFGTISALHGINIAELLDAISGSLPTTVAKKHAIAFRLAIVGEQNVGKSTFLNSLLKDERAIVTEIPGTTRDYIEELLEWRRHNITLIDTAGVRRRSKIREASDFFSISRTKQALKACDVALLIFDASQGFRKDTKITARIIQDSHKGCVLIANKWDLVHNVRQEDYAKGFAKELKFLKRYPLCFISALKHTNIEEPLEYAMQVYDAYQAHISTHELNEFLKTIKTKQAWPNVIKLKYITQTSTAPPAFALFVKGKRFVTATNRIFLENQLIKHFNIRGVHIKLAIKEEKTWK